MKYKKWSLSEKLEILASPEAIGIVETCRKYSLSTGTLYSWKKKHDNKNRSYKVFESLYNRLLTHYSHILSNRHESHIIDEIKQNLQIKTFIETSENAVKSQIYVVLITCLLLQLIVKTIAKKKHAFSNFVEKIRVCLNFHLTLDYVCNQVGEGAKRVRGKPQEIINFNADLFS